MIRISGRDFFRQEEVGLIEKKVSVPQVKLLKWRVMTDRVKDMCKKEFKCNDNMFGIL